MCPIGTEAARTLHERMDDLVLWLRRVPGDEDPDAVADRARHGDLAAADERHLGPSERAARRVRGERGIEIWRDREPDVPDVLRNETVEVAQRDEQLGR